MRTRGQNPTRAERRREIALGLLRASGVVAGLVAVYYLAPYGHLEGPSLAAFMIVALVAGAVMTAVQVRAILGAARPGIRAIEALATTVPLFVLLFSAAYFMMSQTSADSFNVHPLTRTDTLYFTVTVLATVGFGDITPASQVARLAVTAQMVLNLIVIGIAVRLIIGAAQHARRRHPEGSSEPGKSSPDHPSP